MADDRKNKKEGVREPPHANIGIDIPKEHRDPRLEASYRMPSAASEDPNSPKPIAPLPVTTRTVNDVYGDSVETVTMLFPHAVTIMNKQNIKIRFKAGPQEVPKVDEDNWYLKANGVERYKK